MRDLKTQSLDQLRFAHSVALVFSVFCLGVIAASPSMAADSSTRIERPSKMKSAGKIALASNAQNSKTKLQSSSRSTETWDDELDVPVEDSGPVSHSSADSTSNSDGLLSGRSRALNPLSWKRRKETVFDYRFKSEFDSFVNEREQSQFFGFVAETQSRIQFLDQMWVALKARAVVASGFAQSQFGDNVGNSGIFLGEAAVNYQAIQSDLFRLKFSGGAIDQSFLEMRTLIDRQPFPGLMAQTEFGPKDFLVRVSVQNAIPTSRSLSTRTVDVESMPNFQSEKIEIERNSETERIRALNVFATHYAYRNLPSAVAFQSSLYGNTLNDPNPTPNNSRFKYGFDGFGAGAFSTINLVPSLDLLAGGYILQNLSAPVDRRSAQRLEGGFALRTSAEIELSPTFGYYFTESDVAPAFYSAPQYGHMNREGFQASLRVDFKRQQFRIESSFVDSDLINPSPGFAQTRQQTFFVRFETLYDVF